MGESVDDRSRPVGLADLDVLGERVMTAISRLADTLLDISFRLGRLENAQVEHDRRLLLLELSRKPKKARPKRARRAP